MPDRPAKELTMNDGVALTSIEHPRPIWYARPYWWLRCQWTRLFGFRGLETTVITIKRRDHA